MTLQTSRGGHSCKQRRGRNRTVLPKIPAANGDLPETVQIHAGDDRNPCAATAWRSACGRQWGIGNPDRRRAPWQRPENFPGRRSLSHPTGTEAGTCDLKAAQSTWVRPSPTIYWSGRCEVLGREMARVVLIAIYRQHPMEGPAQPDNGSIPPTRIATMAR